MNSQVAKNLITEKFLLLLLIVWTPILLLETWIAQDFDYQGALYHWFNNDPPVISTINSQVIKQNSISDLIPFTVEDVDTSDKFLTVSAVSSNPSLVPDSNIFLDNGGNARTIQVKPQTGKFGTSVISLIASDGKTKTTQDFELTVKRDDAPIVSSIGTQHAKQGDTISVGFTLGDSDTPLSSLSTQASSSNSSLIPASNISLYGNSSHRQMVIRPDPKEYGTATISLVVSDGISQVREKFDVIIDKVTNFTNMVAGAAAVAVGIGICIFTRICVP